MFLLIDMEDFEPELRSVALGTRKWAPEETTQVQLLEPATQVGNPGRTGTPLWPHPEVIKQTLTLLEATGNVPSAGRNIPETGQ